MDLLPLGRALLTFGVVFLVAGVIVVALAKGWLPSFPRLPGDLAFKIGSTRVFMPIATSIVVSVVLTVLFNLIARR